MGVTLELLGWLTGAVLVAGGIVWTALIYVSGQIARVRTETVDTVTAQLAEFSAGLSGKLSEMNVKLTEMERRQEETERELHERVNRLRQEHNDFRVEAARTYVTAEPLRELKAAIDRLYGRIDGLVAAAPRPGG